MDSLNYFIFTKTLQMRDSLKKDKEYFDKFIDLRYNLLNKGNDKLNNNSIKPERIDIAKSSFSYKYLTILRAKYSRGDNMFSESVKKDYDKAASLLAESSKEKSKHILHYLEKKKPIFLKQYTLQFHFDMIDMLSLAVLLDKSVEILNLLVDKIDKDDIKDFVYEFLIQSKIEDRLPIYQENFKEFSWYKDRFTKIKVIINIKDKEIAQKELKDFLEKDWYKSLHDTAGYNQHKKDNGNYVGYWCFVAAAIVKIKGLDDSSFRDNIYYPKDIV